jgi:hypothetical protein
LARPRGDQLRQFGSRPTLPSRTASRAAANPASKRRWKPIWSSAPAASTSCRAVTVPTRSRATGFSQNAGMPARAARATSPACAAVAEAITTASGRLSNSASTGRVDAP